MLRLNGHTGEVLSVTAHRLVEFGCTEGQAHALAQVISLEREATDSVVEFAVIEALISAKYAVDGMPEIEYVGGQRRDTLRLEGR